MSLFSVIDFLLRHIAPFALEVSNLEAMVKIPTANVPMPLNTQQCDKFKYGIKQEKKLTYADARKRCASLPDLHSKNSYFSYFKDHAGPDPSVEHQFTYDQVKDLTPSHPKVPRDTCHPNHSEGARRKCTVSLATRWQVRSSQAYGWLPPIDTPNYGFGNRSCMAETMDKSHIVAGGGDIAIQPGAH